MQMQALLSRTDDREGGTLKVFQMLLDLQKAILGVYGQNCDCVGITVACGRCPLVKDLERLLITKNTRSRVATQIRDKLNERWLFRCLVHF